MPQVVMQSMSSDAGSSSEDAESSGVYDVASQKIVGAGVTVGEGVPPSEHELGERRPSSTPAMMRASLLDSCFDGTT